MTDGKSPRSEATDGDDRRTTPDVPGDYEVPSGAEPVVCAHCGAPFADDELLALHRGIEHAQDLDADERAAFEAAYESEAASLRMFRLQALGALVVLYFGLIMAYAVFA